MFVEKIDLFNFRNYPQLSLEFSTGLQIIVGENGQGKTNLIEALSLLTSGDSFRFCENNSLVHQHENEASLRGRISHQDKKFDIKIVLEEKRKTIEIQQKKFSSGRLPQLFPQVVFSPEHLNCIKGSSDGRRHLVDELLVFLRPEKKNLLLEYKRALRQRNRLLKNFAEKKTSLDETKNIIQSLNPIFFDLAQKTTVQRIEVLHKILPLMSHVMRCIFNETPVDISLDYLISGESFLEKSHLVADQLVKRSEELFFAELSTGNSLIGPHKHDISFFVDQKNSRTNCSQGQQRSLILAFKLAQIVYHEKTHGDYPLLLLDDVFSELDEKKRKALILFLTQIQSQQNHGQQAQRNQLQIFITTTDFDLPKVWSQSPTVFKVQNGRVRNEYGHDSARV